MEPERAWSLEALVAETRADVRHLQTDVAELRAELRHDVRRLDSRLFQVLLAQLATLGTIVTLVVTLVSQ